MPQIFISYRRDDSEDITGRIHDHLQRHFGDGSVFMDTAAIPVGVDFRKHFQRAVGQCDILLAIIGDDWLDIRHQHGPKLGERRLDDPDDFVRIEVQTALDRGIPVIPVLVGRATMPVKANLPPELGQLAYQMAAEVRSGRDFHGHVSALIQGIEHLTNPPPPSPPKEPEQLGASASRNATEVGRDFVVIADRLIRGFSSFTKPSKPAPARQPEPPSVIEFPPGVGGCWYARPAGDELAEWRVVTRGPTRVTPVPGEEYLLLLNSDVTRKEVRRVVASLSGLTSLRCLSLPFSRGVTDAELADLKVLTSLRALVLQGTPVTDAGLVHLQSLPALESLSLGSTLVTVAGVAQLQRLNRLRSLSLMNCEQVTDAWLAHIQDFPSLRSIDLALCKRVTDAGLVYLGSLTSLQELDLGYTEITDAGLAHLRSLTELWRIGLSSCKRITDAGLAHLKAFPGLRNLDLQDVAVSDAGLSHLAGHTSLEFLSLCDCPRITDAGLAHLKGLTFLRTLKLHRTSVTDAGLAHLRGLTSLQQVELFETPVTKAGLEWLQREIPACVIMHSPPQSKTPPSASYRLPGA